MLFRSNHPALDTEVVYYPPNQKEGVRGLVIAVEWTGSTIWDTETDQEWPGIRFHVRPSEGEDFWTVVYPEKEKRS